MTEVARRYGFEESKDMLESTDEDGLLMEENGGVSALPIPDSMAEALDFDNPEEALLALAASAAAQAEKEAAELMNHIADFGLDLPPILASFDSDKGGTGKEDHPLWHATACADSVFETLTKIAVGGSQASQEIRQLEQEKEAMEDEADIIATALALRQASMQTNTAWQNRDFNAAAQALQPWLLWRQQVEKLNNATRKKRVVGYTGEYSLEQLDRNYQQLQQVLLMRYEQAVQQGDLELIGQYTPLLGKLQLEPKAVGLYIQFLREVLTQKINAAKDGDKVDAANTAQAPFPTQMAKVYNECVATLRHHLPMVSHYLYKADGDAAVVRLVHEQCCETVLPLWRSYQRDRQLSNVRRHAERLAAQYQAGEVDPDTDASFAKHIGSLADVDAAMEEAALCIQHAESYLRFIEHTCNEVNRARKLRHEQSGSEEPYEALEILPAVTPLHEMVAEVGGQYVTIERCLLLASMQRAYNGETEIDEPRYYRPLGIRTQNSSHVKSGRVLQTVLVQACFYGARRGTQRALCTGHTGTASAMANFSVEALGSGLLEVLRHRAEDYAIAALKPGDGLLVGSANYFTTASIMGRQPNSAGGKVVGLGAKEDDVKRQQKAAQVCAILNDMEVAVHHSDQLRGVLEESIARGFSAESHATEQLRLCVSSLTSVKDQFKSSADGALDSLESILKPRIRAIVGEAVGTDNSGGFMVSPVMNAGDRGSGAGGSGSGTTMRMNYNLDEEGYDMLQLSEGYMTRLCALLEELVQPLHNHLAPRLWDTLWINIVGTTAKRLETLLRKTQFTALGALALDSDLRDFLSFTRERLFSEDYVSNVTVTKSCIPLGRLVQLARVLNVDEAEDAMDAIAALKRKGNWDWKLDDLKTFLLLRFPEDKVKNMLRLQEPEK